MQKLHQQRRHTTPHHDWETTKYTPIERKPEKIVTPQKIAIRPTHTKIKTKVISQPTPLNGHPSFKANGTG
jgi:hypothetical protein